MRMRHAVMRPVRLYSTFMHYLKNGTIVEKNVMETKMCVSIFATVLSKISRSQKNWARYDQKRILILMWSTIYFCQILLKLETSWQIFEKHSNIKFHENPSSGSRVVSWGPRRVDRRTDMTNFNFVTPSVSDVDRGDCHAVCEKNCRNGDWFTQRSQHEMYRDFFYVLYSQFELKHHLPSLYKCEN